MAKVDARVDFVGKLASWQEFIFEESCKTEGMLLYVMGLKYMRRAVLACTTLYIIGGFTESEDCQVVRQNPEYWTNLGYFKAYQVVLGSILYNAESFQAKTSGGSQSLQ